MRPTFFSTPRELQKWFAKNHAAHTELWIGFHKKDSGKPSITWPESVDEALCVGWIDGLRKSLGETSYMIRFTPRKPTSIWSAVNIARAKVLRGEGRMQAAGEKALAARRENKSGIYSYEQRGAELDEPYLGLLRKNKKAHAFFEAQPPGYRKRAVWYVVSAKKEQTRRSRLSMLVREWSRGRRALERE
jgi:uncharacterized protein YdeI (YjbR/CyaY-like superfamily)